MISKAIQKAVEFQDLKPSETRQVFSGLLKGSATDAQIAAFLSAMRMKGETVTELAQAAKVMQKHMKKISPKTNGLLLDVCGSGGDGLNTFNISTAVMFVAAGAGCFVAKHGNKSVSSRCGSAEVLEKLGVKILVEPKKTEKIIEKIGLGFMFAPLYHPSMKNVASARKEIGIRTMFNVLGPIVNPAKAKTFLTGYFDQNTAKKAALTINKTGIKKALIVNAQNGMDELSTCSDNFVFELSNKKIRSYSLNAAKLGFKKSKIKDLKGGSAKENASIIMEILEGEKGAQRDIVVLNAGAAIYANQKTKSIKEGIKLAKISIDDESALQKLELLKEETKK